MKRYNEYNQVDLPWLKETPSHWETKKINQLFEERVEKASDKVYPPLSVTKNGILPQMEHVAKTNAGDNRKKVLIGDFVINSRSDRKGSSGVSQHEGSVSLINTVLKIRQGVSSYWHYLLRSVLFQEEFYRNGKGIVADLWSTNYQSMKSIVVPIPPLEEQNQIANYLDWKINEIDRLIEFEKLKLNEVNKIYEKKLERLFIEVNERERDLKNFIEIPITDGPHETPVFVEKGIPFVSAEAVVKGRIDLTRNRGYISEKDHEIYCKKVKPRRDDIFIVKSGSTTGKIALVDFDDQFSIWSPLALVRVNKDVIFLYMYYMLSSEYFQRQIRLNWSFGTQPNIGMKVISALKIKVPSLEIQKYIINQCVSLETAIHELTEKLENQIESLQLLKQSLISEVVTGKIDVRDIEIPVYEKVDLINTESDDIKNEEE